MSAGRVGVLMGGISSEGEISLGSGNAVLTGLLRSILPTHPSVVRSQYGCQASRIPGLFQSLLSKVQLIH